MKHKVTCRTKKGLQQYKWIKGENPGIKKKKIKKKNPTGGMDVCLL
jgi:hypothetical protein